MEASLWLVGLFGIICALLLWGWIHEIKEKESWKSGLRHEADRWQQESNEWRKQFYSLREEYHRLVDKFFIAEIEEKKDDVFDPMENASQRDKGTND